MREIDPREYGQLETRVAHLENSVNNMANDVKAMRDILEQSKGGWRVMVFVGGAAASAGGVVAWIVSHIVGK